MSVTETCPQCGTKLDPDRPQGLCPACLLRQAMNSQITAAVPESRDGGVPFVPPTTQELAQFFPQLEIFELIGRGGMGAVYRARQRSLDRVVALKVLPPGVSRDPSFEERFTREARALARVNHANIVNVYEFGQSAGGLFYFVMEFVDGVNLRQMIQTHQLAPAQALAIVPQVCDALQYAHDEGIVHRDIKPENILVDRKGRVKIADFGLAKILSPKPADFTLTSPQSVMGTPHYMAPEQLEKPGTVDHRADIYSLGVVFYEMLTGELPLGRFEPPSHKITLDIRLDDVVLKTLEKEPHRRYQRVGMVKTDLATIASQHAPTPDAAAVDDGTAPPATQISTRQRWILLLCALALPLLFVVLPRFLGRPLEIGYATGVGAMLLFVIGSVWESLPPQRRRWLYHPASLMVLMLLIPPLFKALEDPTRMLQRLYAIFGGTMRRHDVPAAKIIAAVLIIYVVVYLVAVFRHLWPTYFPKRSPKPTPATTSPPSADPSAGPDADLAAAREQVRGPALGLFVTGVLNWVGMFVAVGILYYFKFQRNAAVADWVFIVVMPILTFGSGMILFGALKMMRLESFVWANVASILAMVIGPGYLIGWPVGIWSLVTLARPEVQAGFRRRRQAWHDAAAARGAAAARPASDQYTLLPGGAHRHGPRLSRAAVIGALLAPLPLLALPATYSVRLQPSAGPVVSQVGRSHNHVQDVPEVPAPATTPTVEPARPAPPHEDAGHGEPAHGEVSRRPVMLFAVLAMVAFVCMPPLLTTILGVVAIVRIRASRGRLYGLSLAVADALLYPLLALDLLICVFWYYALPHGADASWRGVMILTVVTSILADVWLVRICWRGATSPVAEGRLAYDA